MANISISYLTSTKNKLPYLRWSLDKLISAKKDDEEILVADGGSSDGTTEYLAKLKQGGKINYFVSEPDLGEAHALNKLILLARGTLVLFITDDDIYSYTTIEACKKFMLTNPQIDVLGSNGGSLNRAAPLGGSDPLQFVRALDYEKSYRKWQKDRTPFSFCGLGIMLRRSSLPILGLWDPSFRSADAEYSFRITSGRANIAWYTGYTFVNVPNPQSVSITWRLKIREESVRLYKFYLDKNPDFLLIPKLKALGSRLVGKKIFKSASPTENFLKSWPELVGVAERWVEIKNQEKKLRFIWNN